MSIPVPLPRIAEFEKMGFGMFLHWGIYSQLGEGECIQNSRKIPWTEYRRLAETFTAADFDPEALAALAAEAGMRYITLTTRHHDGFSLYDTCGLNDFDAPHSAAKRDLIAEFVTACRKYDIAPFLYHTTLDWYWREPGAEKSRDQYSFYTSEISREVFEEYLQYLRDSVEILCRNYGRIGGFWFDGNWCRKGESWQEDELYGMIRKYQPDAIIINNTGLTNRGKVGHPELDSVTYENNSAAPMNREGMEKYLAAEVCKTMNCHWGLGDGDFNFLSPGDVIERLCHSRGCGANFLLNFSPSAQGGIPDYERSVIKIVGRWMQWFGEAVYEPKPDTSLKCQGRDFVLRKENELFYFVFDLRIAGLSYVTASLHGPGVRSISGLEEKISSALWMDNGEKLDFIQDTAKGIASINFTGFPYGRHSVVRVAKITLDHRA